MTEQIIMDRIVDDFIENEKLFKEMKKEISFIIKTNDNDKDFDLTYDDFCAKCLNNINSKNIKWDSTTKTVKRYFFESMIQIATDELIKRGRINESLKIKNYINI
jgi:hypothetical protein